MGAIKRADFKTARIDDLKLRLKRVIEAYAMFPVEIEKGEAVFRAVKHEGDEKGQYLGDLKRLYPHRDFLKSLGRANRERQPIFYVSVDAGVALNEVKAAVGDVCTILECRARENSSPLLMPIGIHEMARKHNARIGGEFADPIIRIKELLENDAECIRKHKIIDDFIAEEFLKVVDEGQEDLYKPTIAIAELLFGFGTDEQPIDGIAYPSIACDQINANLALLPEAFHRIYEPAACRVIKIDEALPDQGFRYSEKTARSISDSGTIEWPNP
jgi:hypothetical protein